MKKYENLLNIILQGDRATRSPSAAVPGGRLASRALLANWHRLSEVHQHFADPDSLNADPDPAFQVKSDPDPGF
jgi:hypothetical protein